MAKPVITVVGGTGLQGGGVVNALLAAGDFTVRVPSRNPSSDAARALAVRGVEVVNEDRSAVETLQGIPTTVKSTVSTSPSLPPGKSPGAL